MYSRGLRHLWDHPRTCGENVSFSASCYDCVGITPAPAGKTLYLYYLPFLRWDHPRTCGENAGFVKFLYSKSGSPPHLRGKLLSLKAIWWCIGSPPHLRGKLTIFPFFTSLSRITPAPAGKTLFLYILLLTLWDHPRTCGENIMIVSMWSHYEGSPPHLRGKRSALTSSCAVFRITPAPAGKT